MTKLIKNFYKPNHNKNSLIAYALASLAGLLTWERGVVFDNVLLYLTLVLRIAMLVYVLFFLMDMVTGQAVNRTKLIKDFYKSNHNKNFLIASSLASLAGLLTWGRGVVFVNVLLYLMLVLRIAMLVYVLFFLMDMVTGQAVNRTKLIKDFYKSNHNKNFLIASSLASLAGLLTWEREWLLVNVLLYLALVLRIAMLVYILIFLYGYGHKTSGKCDNNIYRKHTIHIRS